MDGMEMMLNRLLQAAGFNPQKIAEQIGGTVGAIQAAMQELQNTLTRIEQMETIINARLDRIELALAIKDNAPESGEPVRRLISG